MRGKMSACQSRLVLARFFSWESGVNLANQSQGEENQIQRKHGELLSALNFNPLQLTISFAYTRLQKRCGRKHKPWTMRPRGFMVLSTSKSHLQNQWHVVSDGKCPSFYKSVQIDRAWWHILSVIIKPYRSFNRKSSCCFSALKLFYNKEWK